MISRDTKYKVAVLCLRLNVCAKHANHFSQRSVDLFELLYLNLAVFVVTGIVRCFNVYKSEVVSILILDELLRCPLALADEV